MTTGWVTCNAGSFTLEADWDVRPGEVLVLFGPSGAGKTTTLRAIAGLLRPRQGRIEIGGRTVYEHQTGTWVPSHRRGVGYLTQQPSLFPHLNVSKNIAYGIRRSPKHSRSERVEELIAALQLEGLEERRPWELSGGQQQRVALARALAPYPEVLLLDEPFASLDMELRRVLRAELRSMLAQWQIPVLLVTHDREDALALGDSVQVIDEGCTIARGAALDVLGQPGQARVARLVGVENRFRLKVESRNPRDGTMVCAGAGIRIEAPLDETASIQDEVTVAVRASDIILANHEILGTTARNRLRGTISSVELRAPGYEVTLDCGPAVRCQITGGALEEMNIKPGQTMWAVFKASSCFLIQEPTAAQTANGC